MPGGNLVAKVLADEVSRAKAEAMLSTAADRAACMVLEHREALLGLAASLCDNDEITGDEIGRIVSGAISA